MTTGKRGIALIKKWEKFMPRAYKCPANVATIGYGTTIYPNGVKVSLSDPDITEVQAEKYLLAFLKPMEEMLTKNLTAHINQNQFDALIVFGYNCGLSALKNSTLLKKVNQNPFGAEVSLEFMKWTIGTVNGVKKKLNGLVNRRTAELELYNDTEY